MVVLAGELSERADIVGPRVYEPRATVVAEPVEDEPGPTFPGVGGIGATMALVSGVPLALMFVPFPPPAG